MDKLELSGMEFFSGIGCYKEEKLIGTKFLVDLIINTDCLKPAESDDIFDAINYVTIYKLVKKEMSVNCNLIENSAHRILKSVLSLNKEINSATVRLSKINPAIGRKLNKVTVEMSLKNEI